MSKFEVGDRVEYTGEYSPHLSGKIGTVIGGKDWGSLQVHFDDDRLNFDRRDGTRWYGCMPENLTLVPQLQYKEDQPQIEDDEDI